MAKRLKHSINSSLPVPAFIKGQLWQLCDTTRFIQIGHVGRLLVSHRTIVPSLRRSLSRQTLSSVKDLQRFLTTNKAVLVESCS
jgi:hypothetical protein